MEPNNLSWIRKKKSTVTTVGLSLPLSPQSTAMGRGHSGFKFFGSLTVKFFSRFQKAFKSLSFWWICVEDNFQSSPSRKRWEHFKKKGGCCCMRVGVGQKQKSGWRQCSWAVFVGSSIFEKRIMWWFGFWFWFCCLFALTAKLTSQMCLPSLIVRFVVVACPTFLPHVTHWFIRPQHSNLSSLALRACLCFAVILLKESNWLAEIDRLLVVFLEQK